MAVDYLRQLVEDYNAGKVTLGDTMNRLEFLAWAEDKKPLPQDYIREPRDPADILVERERSKTLEKYLVDLKERLSPENWKIVVMVSKGFTYEQIGEELGISRQAVAKHLLTVRRHAEGMQELLRRDPSKLEAGHAMVKVAYPMDAAMRFLSRCQMPEYLSESFGDTCTKCSMCENCRRKVANR